MWMAPVLEIGRREEEEEEEGWVFVSIGIGLLRDLFAGTVVMVGMSWGVDAMVRVVVMTVEAEVGGRGGGMSVVVMEVIGYETTSFCLAMLFNVGSGGTVSVSGAVV